MLRRAYSQYLQRQGSYIGEGTTLKNTPIFPHGLHGIFISGYAKIGENCIIYQNVTIGSNTIPDSKRIGAPTIGDNVMIGAGATLIGGISIGNNCRIGANCTVAEDIPDNCVVVTGKPRVIQKKRIENRYYTSTNQGWIYIEDGARIIEHDMQINAALNKAFGKT